MSERSERDEELDPDDNSGEIESAAGEGSLQLDLPAVHAAARMARHLIRPFARAGGVRGTELDNLVLVADELLSNAVDHGAGAATPDQPTGPRMQLVLSVHAGTWRLDVTDQGRGDPAVLRELIHPEGLPDLEDERGRGFFLIGQMVDRIEVEVSSAGLGLTLSVTRAVTPARPDLSAAPDQLESSGSSGSSESPDPPTPC